MESDFETAARRGNAICMDFHLINARIINYFLGLLKEGNIRQGLVKRTFGERTSGSRFLLLSPSQARPLQPLSQIVCDWG